MKINFRIVDEQTLSPYHQTLSEIERSILYPLSEVNDQFSIIHGEQYHAFFTEMGKTYFVIALDDGRVFGNIAFTWKRVTMNGKSYTGLYLADMKLSKSYRGKRIIQRMLWCFFLKWLTHRCYQGWDFVFAASMLGDLGDVTRSFSGLHLGNLANSVGMLDIYFCSPEQLIKLSDNCPRYPSENSIVQLSQVADDIKDNSGLKEFRLASTQKAWPLVHLPFPVACWKDGLGFYLRRCAKELIESLNYSNDSLACFSLDRRLLSHRKWLNNNNIQPGAVCTVYHWALPFFGQSPTTSADYIHLSTNEI